MEVTKETLLRDATYARFRATTTLYRTDGVEEMKKQQEDLNKIIPETQLDAMKTCPTRDLMEAYHSFCRSMNYPVFASFTPKQARWFLGERFFGCTDEEIIEKGITPSVRGSGFLAASY